MQHLSWSSSREEVTQGLAALTPSKGIIVGPGWVDIGTLGELQRQVRRGRSSELVPGIYLSLQGDIAQTRETFALLVAIDAARFFAADKAFHERNPDPKVGHAVPRRAKHPKMVAHGWGHPSDGPIGCAPTGNMDQTWAVAHDFAVTQQQTTR
jgi:hypothetical protein